jgi:hypothetical protein
MTNPTNPAPTDPADVTLLNGRRAPIDFYTIVRDQVAERLPALAPGVDYTTEQICGTDFWPLLTHGECRLAGQVLKDLVLRGLAPLVLVEWAHEFPLKFRLI